MIPEPPGGAHSDWDATASSLQEALVRNLKDLRKLSTVKLLKARWSKYDAIGEWSDAEAEGS